LVSAFISSCGNEKSQDNNTPQGATEEHKTLSLHPKDGPSSKKEPIELKKEPNNKKPQQEQAEHVEQGSQAKVDNPENKTNQATSSSDEKASRNQALAQEELQLLKPLKTLIKKKCWGTVKQNFHEAKGNLEEINNRIQLITLTLKKFKALIGETEEKDAGEDVVYPTLADMLAYVKSLTLLTQVSKKDIDPTMVTFIHTLDLTQPNPLGEKELPKKIATNLNKLMGNTGYISAFNQVNEKILAIYQNLQQQAELHQATS
jgi:hypothetical protein